MLSLEQENDSLRLALQIIVQEKNECDSRPQKADDRWSLVENTHPAKSMKNKRINRQLPVITLVLAIDLSSLEMRFNIISSIKTQRQITKQLKIKETKYQVRDIPRLQTLETALIEQRESQTVKGMIQQINRQREKKCL